MNEQRPDPHAGPPASVDLRVTRSGGMAGLQREWRAEAQGDAAVRWAALIDRCAWDERGDEPARERGADRFVWGIRARCDGEERAARLPEGEVRGPWRDLVDEVRAHASATRP